MTNVLENEAASKVTEKLFLNAELADVDFKFNVDGEIERLPANKAILAVESPVFHSMFYGLWKEEGDVEIVDASADAFREFLQFFYLTKVTLTMENIEAVARLADKYDVLHFLNACSQLFEMKLTKENMCYAYQMALHLKDDTLIQFCEKEIGLSPKEVFASDAFLRCDIETLERILDLGLVCNEVDIFEACLKWAKYQCQNYGLDETRSDNLKEQLGDCLKSIRFGVMKIEEFTKYYALHRGLFSSDEFEDIVLMLTVKGHVSKKFNQSPRSYIWNKDNVLKCKRIRENSSLRNYVNLGVIWLTSNQSVLLGEVTGTHYILKDKDLIYKNTFEVSITILELDPHSKALVSVLYDEKSHFFDNNQPDIALSQPIFIKPQALYEIRITSSDMDDGLYHNTAWEATAELEDGLTLQFHRDPSLNYDNVAIGWICGLGLNRI